MAGDGKITLLITKWKERKQRSLTLCTILFSSHPSLLSVYPSSLKYRSNCSSITSGSTALASGKKPYRLVSRTFMPPPHRECGSFTSSCLNRSEDVHAYGSSCSTKSRTDNMFHFSDGRRKTRNTRETNRGSGSHISQPLEQSIQDNESGHRLAGQRRVAPAYAKFRIT